MKYLRIDPTEELKHLVVCYWVVDSEGDDTIEMQKIIPDGYPEIILHYGDPFRINISGSWQTQTRYLLAGQIRNHFFLENTGVVGMIGIKLQPAAVHQLFGVEMAGITDRVVSLEKYYPDWEQLSSTLTPLLADHEKAIPLIEKWLSSLKPAVNNSLDRAIKLILDEHGMVGIKTVIEAAGIGERQLERLFKKQVGLPPKFYSRVIRFSYIFHQIAKDDFSWAGVAFKTGYTDQSHFIKNFKEFTGEDPSGYMFDHENMANFFMKK